MRTDAAALKSIIDPLQVICRRGHDFPRVYSDWLALSCHAFTRDEDAYMELITRYRDNHAMGERNADQFAEALAAWLGAMKTDMQDYLGKIFEEHVSHGEKGQYFTPEHLCKLMTQMTSPNLKEGERVHDPACGSGRMLFAAAEVNPRAHLSGIDLDINCVRMTALNLLCFNVNGNVVWGNALSAEAFGGYAFSRSIHGGELHTLSKEEALELLEGPLQAGAEERQEDQPETKQMEMEL